MLHDLSGHVAFVTGATQGIGRAIARRLAAHGAPVIVSASGHSREGLEETCALIRRSGGKAAWLSCDLNDGDARATLVAEAEKFFGPIDVLVNNAASQGAWAPPSKIDLKARRLAFEVNLHASIDLIQQALPAMRKSGFGRILNITSQSVYQPPLPYAGNPKFTHAMTIYGASKTALDRYTVGLAGELHGTGIHVNGLLPHRIAWSESADQIARASLPVNPDWVEPLTMMAEAAFILIAGAHSGLITTSRELLQRTQSPLHALDGRTLIGDATTIPTASDY
jgi:NAD(P)-dependent dehydrogenase (short-subunit alcohol dehydrogenase family)